MYRSEAISADYSRHVLRGHREGFTPLTLAQFRMFYLIGRPCAITEYQLCDRYETYYISTRACRAWAKA